MRKIINEMAETLLRQRGVQYEFGPEYEEYCAKKVAGILQQTRLKPLSEMISEDSEKNK